MVGYTGGCFSVSILIFQIHCTASLSLPESLRDRLSNEAMEWTTLKAKLTQWKWDHLPYLHVVFCLRVWRLRLETPLMTWKSLQPVLNFAICRCHISCWMLLDFGTNLTPATAVEGQYYLRPNKSLLLWSLWLELKMVWGSCTHLHTRSFGEGAALGCLAQPVLGANCTLLRWRDRGRGHLGWAKWRRYLHRS